MIFYTLFIIFSCHSAQISHTTAKHLPGASQSECKECWGRFAL